MAFFVASHGDVGKKAQIVQVMGLNQAHFFTEEIVQLHYIYFQSIEKGLFFYL